MESCANLFKKYCILIFYNVFFYDFGVEKKVPFKSLNAQIYCVCVWRIVWNGSSFSLNIYFISLCSIVRFSPKNSFYKQEWQRSIKCAAGIFVQFLLSYTESKMQRPGMQFYKTKSRHWESMKKTILFLGMHTYKNVNHFLNYFLLISCVLINELRTNNINTWWWAL